MILGAKAVEGNYTFTIAIILSAGTKSNLKMSQHLCGVIGSCKPQTMLKQTSSACQCFKAQETADAGYCSKKKRKQLVEHDWSGSTFKGKWTFSVETHQLE